MEKKEDESEKKKENYQEEDASEKRKENYQEKEGPVDLGYDPGPREAEIQTKKLRTLWLPKNHTMRKRDRAGMARYKQYRVAVSPAQVVGEGLPNMLAGG